ncbi:MAG TPA: N-acetylmuramoyl-L-alanine amidase [Oscillatoriales cyanobacterium M59_W2019_021]|nr:MAG: cell wall hydrolase [Cyanobacteria bacterium J055]HIK51362.1 N-acetylmuramoyl-L-alanine amidase [Oscillatoriales cyanobacterium M59_W2019_021]
MSRVFLSAAHGGFENGRRDPGSIVGGTTEAQEMILLRDLVASELRARQIEVLAVPDDLSERQSIDWINARTRFGDVALELHADAASSPTARGASAYYIANNLERKANAEQVLTALLRRVPQLPSRGVKPDTETVTGSLLFCRGTIPASVWLEVGFLTNPDDRHLLQNRRQDMALGIADGLMAWVRGQPLPEPSPTPIPSPTPTPTYTQIGININGQIYPEAGLLVNGNAYIPVDLADNLGIDLSGQNILRLRYNNVVYVKAVDLREFNVSVGWDNPNRRVVIRSILPICVGQLDKIMGHGNTTEMQLMAFLKANYDAAANQFPDIGKLYREEASIEGVNYDIAFAQMCLETNFLRFGGNTTASQNNFGGLGSATGTAPASFSTARLGVRAHVQHLKAYASTEPIVQEIIDPRFRFLTRGVAPLVGQLNGRWSAAPNYGEQIMALVRRLYESARLL